MAERATESKSPAKVRKPYLKPAFLRERAFETMALACGKLNSSQAQCKSVKKSS